MAFRFLYVLGILVCSFNAAASGYIGFSFGSTEVKADLTSAGGGQLDESTGLSKLYGGYRWNRYAAVEVAYFDLAQVSVSQLGVPPNNVSASVDMKALGLYGVVHVPFTKHFEAMVKAGGASWEADLQRNAATAQTDGLDMFYGLGAAYAFTKSLAVTADWEVIDSPNPEFSTLSLGFRWVFD